MISNVRLYLIRYTDGDLEHLTGAQVRERQVGGDQPDNEVRRSATGH